MQDTKASRETEKSKWRSIQKSEIKSLNNSNRKRSRGTSLVAQWVRLCPPNAGDLGSIPGWGTRSLMHAATKRSRTRQLIPSAAKINK